ncbi:exocyst complex component 5 [Eurytemora carolleeae]|uniref:exocyst complex component 5 n=1 Tax=Eurytemora carolleeae TaxID=1294199 RepID=UPI000C757635|nr:exocyst complex component 5 [Eurytemora carolleeae]|eukprot:XP_023341495.1 exocyst complex component 5-like [Eurytemora affinis]
MSVMKFWADMEQDEYDPEEFVERLAFRARSGSNSADLGEAQNLHTSFLQAIKELKIMHEKQEAKCKELEDKSREEERAHWTRVAALIHRNKAAAATYKSLDEKINSVAGKVVYLGDQLESVNTPRARAVEALRLIKHFDEFLDGETSVSPVFMDKSRLYEAADIIQKLNLIGQELPEKEFSHARRSIDAKYNEIEKALIEEFIKHHRSDDKVKMAELAVILSHFRGYNECVNAFIEQIQLTSLRGKDPFKDIVPLCRQSWDTISQVFPSPSNVMAKFVLNIYYVKLKEYITDKLQDKNDTEKYLKNLYFLYSQTIKLNSDLSNYNLGSDHLFLSRLTKDIFSRYLETYINIESRYLNDRARTVLQKYYENQGHQRKQMSGGVGTVQELKREMHGLIAARTNFNLAEILDYGGKTFLSDDIAIMIIQEAREAFRRCQVLSKPSELSSNAMEIFNILVSYLLHYHVDYAVELGLAGIPLPETKVPPETYFFDIIRQTNTIIFLVDKLFSDSLVPLVVSTSKHADCLQTKKNEWEKLESKLDTGLDRSIATIAGWIKTILTTEQKKTDYNPQGGEAIAVASGACLKVVKWIAELTKKIRDSLDGRNLEWVLQELGIRLHRTVYEHLMQFQFASAGAMTLICDMQEYRKCVSDWKVGTVTALFETLHAMCNLLILPPENLRGAAMGDQLANMDKGILDNWLQLRVDYKTARLANCL